VQHTDDYLTFTCLDEDIKSEDEIGKLVIKIVELCEKGGVDNWFSIQREGKDVGLIHLMTRWTPDE